MSIDHLIHRHRQPPVIQRPPNSLLALRQPTPPCLTIIQIVEQEPTSHGEEEQEKGPNDLRDTRSEEREPILPLRCDAVRVSLTHPLSSLPYPIVHSNVISLNSYLKAAEVGRAPTSSKYELHVRLRTPKNGAVVRNRLRLPHPVKTSQRICVICPADSTHAQAALDAGASVVGEQEVFDAVKDGRIEFERCICHQDSLSKLAASGVARILGPRGLMPNAKMGTVVKDVGATVRDMAGGSEYRERLGVVRMAVGQLGFTPEEVQRNVRAFLESVKRDIAGLSDRISKDIHEVVISSTHGPGLSLSGEFRNANSIPPEDLSVV